MAKITQHQAIFYQLYKARKKDIQSYIPIWQFIGEIYIEELKTWVFVSYEVSARMSELKKANPNLFEYKDIVGQTGATYNAYRIKLDSNPRDILNQDLLKFYQLIARHENR